LRVPRFACDHRAPTRSPRFQRAEAHDAIDAYAKKLRALRVSAALRQADLRGRCANARLDIARRKGTSKPGPAQGALVMVGISGEAGRVPALTQEVSGLSISTL
jgi:hypothetical protein